MKNLDEVKRVLDNLGVLTPMKEAFAEYGIPVNDENLYKAGFGFHKITENYGTKVIMEEEVMKDLRELNYLQNETRKEKTFALLGLMTVLDGETIFYINHCLKGYDPNSTVRSSSFTEEFTNQVNNYINSDQVHNRFVLMGHTHPDIDEVLKNGEDNYQENEIQKAIFAKDKKNSSFLLRKAGLNISVTDVAHLVHFSNEVNGKGDILIGTAILLPHMELNILFHANHTIQFCNEAFSFDESGIRPIDNFLTSSNSQQIQNKIDNLITSSNSYQIQDRNKK